MKNKQMIGGAVAVVLIGAAFYGGVTYQKSQMPQRGQFALSAQGGPGAQFAGRAGARTGAGFVSGEILSKDASGITVKSQDGSTKIVLLGSSAQISKSAVGTPEDLSIGTDVLVNGSANSDGSITAQNVQIRPAGTGPFSSSTRQQP